MQLGTRTLSPRVWIEVFFGAGGSVEEGSRIVARVRVGSKRHSRTRSAPPTLADAARRRGGQNMGLEQKWIDGESRADAVSVLAAGTRGNPIAIVIFAVPKRCVRVPAQERGDEKHCSCMVNEVRRQCLPLMVLQQFRRLGFLVARERQLANQCTSRLDLLLAGLHASFDLQPSGPGSRKGPAEWSTSRALLPTSIWTIVKASARGELRKVPSLTLCCSAGTPGYTAELLATSYYVGSFH